MHKPRKVLIAFGTRPEALKFVPVIKEIEKTPGLLSVVCLTGQHRKMLEQVIRLFKIEIHANLELMTPNQTLEALSAGVLHHFGGWIRKIKPDILMVQGDTSTALMAGIAGFYAKIPVIHLEAGLRTRDKYQPFPEEMNRRLLSRVADYHLTPTATATRNLVREGIASRSIFETGNTIVDTVRLARPLIKIKYPVFRNLNLNRKILFVTAHRRESFGRGLENIFKALKKIIRDFPETEIVYPVHLNPNVQHPARAILSGQERIHLIRPLTYEETCWIMERAYFILTDSGGIQEEAPSFQKPVLVLRRVTERPEGVQAGVAKLVGTDPKRIERETRKLLMFPKAHKAMIAATNPYGDGHSAERTVMILKKILSVKAN